MVGIHDVRWYHGDMVGVTRPRLCDTPSNASHVIQVLDDCLVNGFNLRTVTGIVVANGIATATTSVPHGFLGGAVIRVEGATPAELNGDWKTISAEGSEFRFATSAPAGSASGTLSAKVAPLGWTKDFSGTNTAVYRPKSGLRHCFRVDDPSGSFVRIRGFESMTSIDSGDFPFPTPAQVANGINWFKYYSDGYSSKWKIIGDDRFFLLLIDPTENNGFHAGVVGVEIYGFGEIKSFAVSDAGSSVVFGAQTSYASAGRADSEGLQYCGHETQNSYFGNYVARSTAGGPGVPGRVRAVGHGLSTGWGITYNNDFFARYPNPVDGSLLLHTPVLLQEESGLGIRGELPGIYQPLHGGASVQLDGAVVRVGGRDIWLLAGPDSVNGYGNDGLIGFDITGPWR